MSVQKAAEDALKFFTEGGRQAEHHGGKVTVLTPDAPDWLREVVYAKSGSSDFRVEVAQTALLAISEEDPDFDPSATETHARASYKALAADADLRRNVDLILGNGYRLNLGQLISKAAHNVMIDMIVTMQDRLEENLEDEPEGDEGARP